MIKQYFKQAWTMVQQNKLYSTIYILGTALGITMVMVIAIYFYTRVGSVYPEYDRSRIYTVKQLSVSPKDTARHEMESSLMSYDAVKNCFYNLMTPEAVTAMIISPWEDALISQPGSDQVKSVIKRYVDPAFWQFYDFDFIEGKPFSPQEFDAGIRKAVISDSTAKYLFPDGGAVGGRFVFNDEEYVVSGVVREPSFLASNTFANLYLPYTTKSNYQEARGMSPFLGHLIVFIKLKNKGDAPQMIAELNSNIQAYTAPSEYNIDLIGQPDDTMTASFRVGNSSIDMKSLLMKFGGVLLLFLIVPAINLSGLNSSRMEKRITEMGIRKAFGAPRSVLLNQVLVENLLLTFFGALLGLVISFILASTYSDMMMSRFGKMIFATNSDVIGVSHGVTPSMLFNFPIFFVAILLALLINTLSAFIPAYRFTRKNIVESIHANLKK